MAPSNNLIVRLLDTDCFVLENFLDKNFLLNIKHLRPSELALWESQQLKVTSKQR